MKAYVFINVAGEATELAVALRAAPGVIAADATTGEIDVIAVCEGISLQALNRVVTGIQQLPGVIKSTTRVVVGPPPKSTTGSAVAA